MIVFTGATLIDGTGAAPVADAALVIEGERIVAAGPRSSLSWPGDAEVVDVRGKTIIPGLIAYLQLLRTEPANRSSRSSGTPVYAQGKPGGQGGG